VTANRLRALPRWACECKRCGHKWVSTGAKPPERCASCTRRNWQAEPGTLPLGRPKARKIAAAKARTRPVRGK